MQRKFTATCGWMLALLLLASLPLFAQESEASFFDNSNLNLGLGAEVIDGETYQSLSLKPDIDLGGFGIGLDLKLRYTFSPDDPNASDGEGEFQIREEDWIVEDGTFGDWVSLYLSKLNYVRLGQRGEPLYVKAGNLDSDSMGNGFVMGGYSNSVFLPETRYLGLHFGLDGLLFGFPYVGFEAMTNDIGNLDILAARLYVRPLAWMDLPLFNQLQIGASYYTDRNSYIRYASTDTNGDGFIDDDFDQDGTSDTAEPIGIIDFDLLEPILSNPVISLALFGDLVFQGEQQNTGGMIGLGGQLFSLLDYGAQIRIMGDNFIPSYFNSTYEYNRAINYTIINSTDTVYIPATQGYFISAGTTLFEEMLIFSMSLAGAFGMPENLENIAHSKFYNPSLDIRLIVEEGLIPNVAFSAYYTKEDIESFDDLIDPSDALIGAQLDYISSPAVISFLFDVSFDPVTGEFDHTSSLQTSIDLF